MERIHEVLKSLDWLSITRENKSGNMVDVWRKNFLLLNVLFKEVSPKTHPTKKKALKDHKKKLRQLLNVAIYNALKGRKVDISFLDEFDEFELELRQVIEDKGLLMPDKGTWEEAMEA